MSPPDPTPTPEALAQRVDELGSMVEALAGDLARLIEMTSVSAQSWLLVSDAQVARDLLDDLCRWLDAVYLRFQGVELPTCWAWHPDVVDELLWLRAAHVAAYSGRGWESRAGLWHQQQRPGVVERIRTAVGTCDLASHVSGGPKPVVAPLAVHLDAVADHWVTYGLPPKPTDEQLQQATEYDELLNQHPST